MWLMQRTRGSRIITGASPERGAKSTLWRYNLRFLIKKASMPGLTYRFISVILVAAFSDSLRTLSGYPIQHPALSVSSVPSWVILYRLLLWFEYRLLNVSTA